MTPSSFTSEIRTWIIVLSTLACHLTTSAEEKFYDPIEKKLEGWTLAVDPELMKEKNVDVQRRAMEALANHLQRVKYIVPEVRLKQLQSCRSGSNWITGNWATCSITPLAAGCWLTATTRDW